MNEWMNGRMNGYEANKVCLGKLKGTADRWTDTKACKKDPKVDGQEIGKGFFSRFT